MTAAGQQPMFPAGQTNITPAPSGDPQGGGDYDVGEDANGTTGQVPWSETTEAPNAGVASATDSYNASNALTKVLTDNTNGTSNVDVFNPSGTVSSQDTFYSGLNGAGSETKQIIDDTNGTSSIESLHPTSAISTLTYDYAGLNGAGAVTFAIQDNSNGTAVDNSYNTPGASDVVWNYNAGGVLTTEQLYTLSGETYNYTYNAGSWVGNLTITAPTFTQVQVYTSPNTMSELTDNYSNGDTYVGYYATGTAGDPLTQTITGTPGVAIVTSDFDTAVAGDPIGVVQVQQPSGVVSDYGYADTLAADPLTTLISNVPNNYVATYSYDDAIAADPLDQLIVQSVNGAVDKAAYDVSGGTWSSAVAYYNPSGIETELETDYTNNTSINQLFNGQAQGWTGQEFWYSAGLITQNTINFTNGVSYDLTYAGASLYTYLIDNPAAGYYSVTTENLGGEPWNSYTSFYTSAGVGYESVAAYNGFSMVDGNQYVVGNNADVPGVGDDDADSDDSDPLGVGGDGSDGGDGSSGDGSSGAPGNPGGTANVSSAAVQAKSVASVTDNSPVSSSASSPVPAPNTLDSGSAATTLTGGGDTTYVIQGTSAAQTILNSKTTGPMATGEVEFQNGAKADDLWFIQSGQNLLVDVLGTQEQVTVQNWFSNRAAQVTEFVSADSLKLDTQLATLIQAMATYSGAHASFNPQATTTLIPNAGALSAAVKAAWHS